MSQLRNSRAVFSRFPYFPSPPPQVEILSHTPSPKKIFLLLGECPFRALPSLTSAQALLRPGGNPSSRSDSTVIHAEMPRDVCVFPPCSVIPLSAWLPRRSRPFLIKPPCLCISSRGAVVRQISQSSLPAIMMGFLLFFLHSCS